jgi:hypothetical protein
MPCGRTEIPILLVGGALRRARDTGLGWIVLNAHTKPVLEMFSAGRGVYRFCGAYYQLRQRGQEFYLEPYNEH